MALILGVDPSAAKIAVVGFVPETLSQIVRAAKTYPKGTSKQTPESLSYALGFVSDLASEVAAVAPEGQRFAYVESPLVGRGGTAATIKQAYVGGIIRGCLAAAGFKVYDAHPSTWRSGLGIKARGTDAVKAATRQYVQAEWPKAMSEIGTDVDLTDAAAICLYGVEQVRKAGLIGAAATSRGAVQGDGPAVVVRPARVRPRVRRR